jgi:hypothetical protein
MMEILKKNFSIILITLMSLGVIFYLRRQISNLIKENLELKKNNITLKEISTKAYSEIENIKKTIFQNGNIEEPVMNMNIEEPFKNINIEEPVKDKIIINNSLNYEIIETEIIDEEKPPIEFVNIPEPILNQKAEFIIMSETIPDVEGDLINNLIDNNLVHLPFKKSNSDMIQEIDDDDESLGDDVEEIIVEQPPIQSENINIPKIIQEESNVTQKSIEEEEPEKITVTDNVKVLKFNNINEKLKEDTKLNIKFQPKVTENNDSESEKSLDYTNNEYLEINNNVPVKIEEKKEPNNIDYISNNYNINHVNLSSLEKLNIRDIQNISKRYKLDIKKINSKGDKKINKTKKELCTEIISYLNI